MFGIGGLNIMSPTSRKQVMGGYKATAPALTTQTCTLPSPQAEMSIGMCVIVAESKATPFNSHG